MKKMKITLNNSPMWFKLLIAKVLLRCMDLSVNDIVLYNELKLWIDTQGRPTTSNPNYWINNN
jgi:hypothetical protein